MRVRKNQSTQAIRKAIKQEGGVPGIDYSQGYVCIMDKDALEYYTQFGLRKCPNHATPFLKASSNYGTNTDDPMTAVHSVNSAQGLHHFKEQITLLSE